MKDVWNVARPNEIFLLPCFKVKTRWVRLRLSIREKASAMNINELVVNKILQSESDFPMLKNKVIAQGEMLPGKIGQILLEWSTFLWGTENVASTGAENVEVSGVKSGQESDPNQQRFIPKTSDDEYLQFKKEYIEAYGQKAAKNDDEAVPVQLWDRAVLRNQFEHLNYSNKIAKALNLIRDKLAFRWYLRCLRKSLFTYLKIEYGCDFWKLWKSSLSKKRKRDRKLFDKSSELTKDLEVARGAKSST